MFKKSVKDNAVKLHNEGKTNEEILAELNPVESRLTTKTLESWFSVPKEGNGFKASESIKRIESDMKEQKLFLIDLTTEQLEEVKKVVDEHQTKATAFLKLVDKISHLNNTNE